MIEELTNHELAAILEMAAKKLRQQFCENVSEAAKRKVTHDDLIPLSEAIRMSGLKRSSVYLRISQGDFPKQIKLGLNGRNVRFSRKEIEEWVNKNAQRRV